MTDPSALLDLARTCPSCRLREKRQGMDTERGDFWRCLAEPVVPAFTGDYVRRFDPPLINLRSFEDDHPCHEYQRAKTCPLWQPAPSLPTSPTMTDAIGPGGEG